MPDWVSRISEELAGQQRRRDANRAKAQRRHDGCRSHDVVGGGGPQLALTRTRDRDVVRPEDLAETRSRRRNRFIRSVDKSLELMAGVLIGNHGRTLLTRVAKVTCDY